jgi:hypothetical protein
MKFAAQSVCADPANDAVLRFGKVSRRRDSLRLTPLAAMIATLGCSTSSVRPAAVTTDDFWHGTVADLRRRPIDVAVGDFLAGGSLDSRTPAVAVVRKARDRAVGMRDRLHLAGRGAGAIVELPSLD